MTDDRSSNHGNAHANANAWREFPNTVLHFAAAPIDLRELVTPAMVAQLAAVGLGDPFGVITAYNPLASSASQPNDATRNSRLHATLIASGCRCIAVDACSPDRSHCEPSFAVLTRRDVLLSLARLYDQLAIFWFDGSHFWIVPAQPGFEEIVLPLSR
jgi:hypothetical protein